MPVRRLVLTGKDTPENLALFFGHGQANAVEDTGGIAQSHKDSRIEALLRPPPGSPMYVLNRSLKHDRGCPTPWTPREPSAAEARHIQEVRDMQETIRRHKGVAPGGRVENITNNDMRDILVQNFGNRWSEGIKVYMDAINAMDQGVKG